MTTTQADRDERAQAAVKAFRALQPGLSGFARALTGKRNVRVELATGGPRTDGEKIFFQPPIELGDRTPHDRMLCDKRDKKTYLQRCPACAIREGVLASILHEISHIAFGTFEKPTPETLNAALDRALNEVPSKYAEKVRANWSRIPDYKKKDHLNLSSVISPFLPLLNNVLEDVRVERAMFKARPGTRLMFAATSEKMFREGVPNRDGTVDMWIDRSPNSQITIGLYVLGCGMDYRGWFVGEVEQALGDATLRELIGRVDTLRSAEGTYNIAFPVLARLRELGFLRTPEDPDDEQEAPEEPEPQEEEEEQNDPDDGDSESESEDQDSSDDDPADGSTDGEDSSEDADGEDDESSEGADGSEGEGEADSPEPSDEAAGSDADDGDQGDGEDAPAESGDGTPGDGTPSDLGGDDAGGSDSDPSGADGSDSDEAEASEGAGEPGSEDHSGSPSGNGAGEPSEDAGDGTPGGGPSLPGEPGTGGDAPDDGQAGGSDDGTDDEADSEGPLLDGPEGVDDEPIDTGADDGRGGEKALSNDRGGVKEVSEDLEVFGRHEAIVSPEPPSAEESADIAAIEKAIIQGLYFETSSMEVAGVRIHKWGDESDPCAEGWDTASDQYSVSLRSRLGITGDIEVPEEVVAPALVQMRKAFADNKRADMQRHLKSGRINQKVLGRRAWAGDPRLFQKKRIPGKRDYAVIIGIDISGSTRGQNILLAKRAARTQAELCHRLGVDFAVYAHTANGMRGSFQMDMYEVKTFDQPWNGGAKLALERLQADAGNLDGHSVEFYRKLVEKTPATDKIILYYTDGKMPAANHDEELEILQREIAYCRSHNITLMGVGIRTDSPKRHGLNTVEVHQDSDMIKVVKHLETELLRRR